MKDKELYQQKQRAQLDEWKAEVDKLKARASGASADAQLQMREEIKRLESKIEEGEGLLSELARAGEDTWESIKEGIEYNWESLKSTLSEATSKFKS